MSFFLTLIRKISISFNKNGLNFWRQKEFRKILILEQQFKLEAPNFFKAKNQRMKSFFNKGQEQENAPSMKTGLNRMSKHQKTNQIQNLKLNRKSRSPLAHQNNLIRMLRKKLIMKFAKIAFLAVLASKRILAYQKIKERIKSRLKL